MEIEVSPDQLWHYPLGTPFEQCQSRLAGAAGGSVPPAPRGEDVYDGMYVEAFGRRWLATIAFKDGKIHRQTLVVMSADREDFKRVYNVVREEFGRGIRKGLFKPTGYIWDYASSQLILAIKKAAPLTGIYLILTAKEKKP